MRKVETRKDSSSSCCTYSMRLPAHIAITGFTTNNEFSLHILVPPCSFFEYYRQWEELILSHKDQCLIVYYEDMHKVVFLILYNFF